MRRRMKSSSIISAALGVLVPLLASCASSDSATNGNRTSAPKDAPQHVVLTNAAGSVRLHASTTSIGPIQLQAHDETLFISEFNDSEKVSLPWLRIGAESIPPLAVRLLNSSTVLTSNDWQYLQLAAAADQAGILKSARRHLLLVEPDLVVILDELLLTNSTTIEINLPSRQLLTHDSIRDEWTLQADRAGLVTRFLSLPKSVQSWSATATSSANRGTTYPTTGWMRSVVTESGPEFHQLTIFAVHPKQARRSLAFKLLESDTAIGARIHRDGLPTLVAFRKASCTGEANLTGLKFASPVAVDVFRPKPRKQQPR
jgi:hypothetical protein